MLREEERRRRAEWAAMTDEPFPEEKLCAPYLNSKLRSILLYLKCLSHFRN